MKISTKGRYAIRALVNLAKQDPTEFISVSKISADEEISVKYMERIIGMLNQEGFLDSSRGHQGGHRLNRKPSEYKLSDILRVTEGSLAPVACLENKPNQCPRYEKCSTVKLWEGLETHIFEFFDNITIEDVLNGKDF